MRKLIKKILREHDDFGWMYGEFNPWLNYNVIYFDTNPSKEDINHYIELALTTFNLINEPSWGMDVRELSVDEIIDLFYHYGRYFLGVRNLGGGKVLICTENLGVNYGLDPKIIKYSDLKKSQLKENEQDPFKWIKSVESGCGVENPCVGMEFVITKNDELSEVVYTIVGLDDVNMYLDWSEYPKLHINATKNFGWEIEFYKNLLSQGFIRVVNTPYTIKDGVNESNDDMSWIRGVKTPCVGMKFQLEWNGMIEETIYTVTDISLTHLTLEFDSEKRSWPIKHYEEYYINDDVHIIDYPCTE